MKSRIQLSAGTKLEWENINPILKDREFVVESDTMKAKMGDGVTNYKNLPYANLSLKRIDVDSIHMLDINNVLDVTGETETIYTYQDFYDKKLHRYCPHIDNYYGNFLFDINYRDISENLITHNGLMFTDGDDFFTWTKTNIPKFVPKQYIGIRYFHMPDADIAVHSDNPADYIWSEYTDANMNPIDLNTTIEILGNDNGSEQYFYCRFANGNNSTADGYITSPQPLDNTYKYINWYIAKGEQQDTYNGGVSGHIKLDKDRRIFKITDYPSELVDKNDSHIKYKSCLEIMFSNSPTGENMTKNFGIKNINTSIYYYEDQSKQGISRLTGKNRIYSKLKGKNNYQAKIYFAPSTNLDTQVVDLLTYFGIDAGVSEGIGGHTSYEDLNYWINREYNNMYKLFPTNVEVKLRKEGRFVYDADNGYIFGSDNLSNWTTNENFILNNVCLIASNNWNNFKNITDFRGDICDNIKENNSSIIIYKLQNQDVSNLYSFYIKPIGMDMFTVDINNSTGLNVVSLFGESIKTNKQPMYKKIDNTFSANNKINFNVDNISALLLRNGKVSSDTKVLVMLNYGNGIFSKKTGSITIDEKLVKKVLIK